MKSKRFSVVILTGITCIWIGSLISDFGVSVLAQNRIEYQVSPELLSTEELLDHGLSAFYHADWIEAESFFLQASELTPNDPRAFFFSSMIPFWEYFFVSESSQAASEYFDRSSKAIELSQKQLELTPDDSTMVLLLSGLYGYRSLMAAKESRYVQAMKNGITGFGFTNQLLAYGSERADVRIGRGMYYYMVGSIPSEVRWMFTLFREKGSIEKGFEELELAAEDSSYIGDEAKMILAYLYKKEKRYQDALVYLDRLIQTYPQNPIFLFLKANTLQILGNEPEALALYTYLSQGENPSFSGLRLKSRDFADQLGR